MPTNILNPPPAATAWAALASIPWCCIVPAAMSLLSLTGVVAARLWMSQLAWILLPLSFGFLGRSLWLIHVRQQGAPWARWLTWATAVLVVALWAPRLWAWVTA